MQNRDPRVAKGRSLYLDGELIAVEFGLFIARSRRSLICSYGLMANVSMQPSADE